MDSQYLEKSFKLRLVKYFMFSSLSLLMIQDTSYATDMKCEIKSFCSLSGCQHTDPMTVDPDSNITRNCSISTGKRAQEMTWKQARQEVLKSSSGLSDLVLLKSNSTKDSGNMTCYCTNINFARKLKIIRLSSTPDVSREDIPKDLECHFSGWPLPREVRWYKNDKMITNGTEGIYHSEDKKWKKGEEILRSTLHLPAGHKEQVGFYKCSARNSIPGWKSEAFTNMQLIMLHQCPLPKGPTIDSLEVLAAKSSNVSLSCWIDYDDFWLGRLLWKFNDKPEPLPESGEKYNVELKDTDTRCHKEFILSIFNVTKSDEGTYSCHCLWEHENASKAAIDLKVFDDLPIVQATTETPTTSALLSTPPSGIRRGWLLHLLIVILSVLVGVLLMLCVWFVLKKKKASALYTKKRNSFALDLADGCRNAKSAVEA